MNDCYIEKVPCDLCGYKTYSHEQKEWCDLYLCDVCWRRRDARSPPTEVNVYVILTETVDGRYRCCGPFVTARAAQRGLLAVLRNPNVLSAQSWAEWRVRAWVAKGRGACGEGLYGALGEAEQLFQRGATL